MGQQKYKIKWDLKKHFGYISEHDPRLQKDIDQIKKRIVAFEKKYRTRTDYLKSDTKLLAALKEYETFSKNIVGYPLRYLGYLADLNSENGEVQALSNKFDLELTPYSNKVLFFELRLRSVTQRTREKFLKSPKLRPYKRFLEETFKWSPYDLTESEEKILNLKSLPAASLWVEGVSNVLSAKTVSWKGEDIPLSKANNIMPTLKTSERRKIRQLILDRLEEVSDFAENEINAVVINKKINDELRGFKEPYESRLLSDEVSRKEFDVLRAAVTTDFATSHSFFRLKKQLLRLDVFTYADRGGKLGDLHKKITFPKACNMFRDTLLGVDENLVKILDRYRENGQIDVFPRKGKRGGAYCSRIYKKPVLVFLNHVDDIRSATTLAHEMGHAIHTEHAQKQPFFYQDYSTATAEVASTLFEQLFFDAMFQELSEKEQKIALHDKIQDAVGSVYRQIAGLNFEIDLHREICNRGKLSKDEIALLLNKHMRSYLGSAVQVSDTDGLDFVSWPHVRYFFYMYSYAYGYLVSRALYGRWKSDHSYIKQIKKFMEAGDSKAPRDIFKDIGVDVTNPKFFQEGLGGIADDIKRLEHLTQ